MNALEKLLFEHSIDLDSMDCALGQWADETQGELQSLLRNARDVLSAMKARAEAAEAELAKARGDVFDEVVDLVVSICGEHVSAIKLGAIRDDLRRARAILETPDA